MAGIKERIDIMKDKSAKSNWTDRNITPGYIAWDETGAYQIGCFVTKQDAKQALIEYAKTLNKGEEE